PAHHPPPAPPPRPIRPERTTVSPPSTPRSRKSHNCRFDLYCQNIWILTAVAHSGNEHQTPSAPRLDAGQ
ncbi:hypothetical protein COCMIDRAFT_110683, partial [Bipolaris oryzae ATCC 44560]